MAESGEASKPWSNGTRSAALIAAMLPVAAGIFQEAQQARNRRAEQVQQREAQRERARQEAARADREAANVLLSSFVDLQSGTGSGTGASTGFCARLQFAASQLTDQKLTPQTHSVLIAALKLVDRSGQRTVCGCSDEGPARQGWFGVLKGNIGRTSDVDSSAPLIQEVRSAEADCTPPPVVAMAPAPLPSPVPVPPPRRGSHGAAKPQPVPVPPPPPPPSATAPACRLDASGFAERHRVFVQIPDDSVRGTAAEFVQAINDAPPFKAPGIQQVGAGRSPTRLEVRYAYDQDLAAARVLQVALSACGVSGEPVLRQIAQYQGRVDPHVLEVWWPRPPAMPKGNP